MPVIYKTFPDKLAFVELINEPAGHILIPEAFKNPCNEVPEFDVILTQISFVIGNAGPDNFAALVSVVVGYTTVSVNVTIRPTLV